VKTHLDFFTISLKIKGIDGNDTTITALVDSMAIVNFINETVLNRLNNKDTKTYAPPIRDARGRALAPASTLANWNI
jgi:hypothetical protein